jgi:hypothetical protein
VPDTHRLLLYAFLTVITWLAVNWFYGTLVLGPGPF